MVSLNQVKRVKRNVSGWLVLNKPYDMTSTQAVGKVRWLFGAAKAGHAGTLDPLATGILPIALGEATKTVPFVQDGTKVYRFSVKWGAATATDDAEGEVIATSDHRASAAEIEAVLPDFIGTISQVPPIFSALKIDGERAYDLARAGEKVELAAREIHVDSLKLLDHGSEKSVFEAVCGKGTYVRAIARDIAEQVGTKGHVVGLHRGAVGPFHDEDAVSIEQLEALDLTDRDALLKPIATSLIELPEIRLTQQQLSGVKHGNSVLLTGAGAPVSLDEAWASFAGEVVATGHVEHGQFVPRRVFN
ncbi:tRNA pseudouridine(55) synthase TruB [Devosia algicola]|uniref:tRNA pseudouridine synthase B n=1 Tax=Devosia algicola TaxID=3026418 RepID=A0ABY7YNC3_9HYPH|nr:tRNA pseudouridine(55) synthase TruB [Devosia algicola]WDR02682.1 tRNA pseudouridine(55) synthase TruB [Devosia algicola]